MNNDVKQIINQWKVDRSAIKEDSQSRTVVRFYIPMPAPKTEMGVTVVFSYNNSNQYAIDFLTDDIVQLNSLTKPFIDNLLNNYADVFALDKDNDLRMKTGALATLGSGTTTFEENLLIVMRLCHHVYLSANNL